MQVNLKGTTKHRNKMMKQDHQNQVMVPNVPIVPFQIDSSIAIRIAMGAKMINERALMGRPDVWHKIRVIRGSQYDKGTILKSIFKEIEPYDMIPVRYQVCGEDAYFIVRNCAPAIEKLCKTNLIIKSITTGDAIILMVTLGYATINDVKIHVQPILLTALTKRYDPNQKLLNLESLHLDPDIEKTVYCPLSQIRTANHVLKMAKNAIATIEYLNLQRNDLIDVSAIENSELTSIKYLDLRHNSLLNMSALTPLKNLEIVKLWLDGNPLCENYSTAKQYVDSAKKYCPRLQELDGVAIVPNMPFMYKDYFQDEKTRHLVHKFAHHFFNLHDQLDRTVLRGLYHKDALYSMSCAIPNNVAQKTGLNLYTGNRNLLKKGGKKAAKKNTFLYYTQEQVLDAVSKLPRSYHDKSTFTYDVMYEDDKCIIFCVSGLFKKLSSGTHVLAFSRTFVLSAALDDEYHILNDQYHIYAAPKDVTPDKIVAKYTYEESVAVCFSPSEKSVLITRMKQVTKLNKEWCESYLSEAEWDMRKAIANLMIDLKSSSISESAFVNK